MSAQHRAAPRLGGGSGLSARSWGQVRAGIDLALTGRLAAESSGEFPSEKRQSLLWL